LEPLDRVVVGRILLEHELGGHSILPSGLILALPAPTTRSPHQLLGVLGTESCC
jgi:hypothetical protein